jgi:hypothetical protein
MSNLVVSSTEVEGAGIFHEHIYENDGRGGNQDRTKFSITNLSGNGINIIAVGQEWDPIERKYYDRDVEFEASSVTIEFNGSIENSEFLTMLKAILQAEEIRGIIKP